ncbi:MAG: urea amidolyase associated protein UAAP1 [Caulobacterales bacterium]
MSETGDPKSAQAHARAMAGTVVESMPILPAARAPVEGVAPADMLWAETIGPGGYASKQLARGARLRIEDVGGDANISMLVFNAERPVERLNVADTLKVQWNAYLGPGSLLLSDMGRPLFSILEDSAGTHDAFCGPSTRASNTRAYGEGDNYGPHPNARDRFLIALGKYGLGRKDVHPCINFFKGVTVAADGAIAVQAGPFAPGRTITLRADMDVIVVLANCPHVRDPRKEYAVTPARVSAWRGSVAEADDPIRNAAPERQRAFLNVDDYYAR